MSPRAELKTARLSLRPVAPEDEGAVVDALNDLGVVGWLSVVPYPYTTTDFHQFRTEIAKPGETFAVLDGEGFAGIVGAGKELGYWFAPRCHGRGYATEAARAVMAAQLADDPADVVSGYFEGNTRSANVLTKLGFVEVGRWPKPCRSLGFDRPHVELRLTRDAFIAALPTAAKSAQLPDITPEALIQTARLAMRPMTRADAENFRALVTRPEVARMLFMFPVDWTLPEAEVFLDEWAWRSTLRFRLALVVEDKWAGWIGVSGDAEPEVFYALQPEFAGRGLAREAVAAFANFLFAQFDPPALTAGVFTDNPASARVLQTCGFVLTGEELHQSRARLAPAPAWVYRLSNPKQAAST